MNIVDFKSLGFPTEETFCFPNIINIEVYRSNCPCRCVHCPVGIIEPKYRKAKFGGKSVDLMLFEKIVDEMSHHPHTTLRVHSVGEPLLWKNLIKALKISHSRAVRSWIFTSAVSHDNFLLEEICNFSNIIEVSVNSIAPKDYWMTKGIDAFDLVSKNIRYMYDYIKKNSLLTRLIVSRVQSGNKVEDASFVNYWQSSGIVHDAFVRSYHTYNDLLDEISLGEKPFTKHQPCLVHWARFNISTEGFAIVCFNELFKDYLDSPLILGDINNQTISEIWHGDKLATIRKAELIGDYSKLAFKEFLPCIDCTSCQPLRGNNQTSEFQICQMS